KDQLSKADIDKEFAVSLFDYSLTKSKSIKNQPEINNTHIGEVQLVGAGAIGNATVWALSNITNLRGTLEVIDQERIDLSNLQRYVLSTQADIKELKVDVAEKFLSKTKLSVVKQPYLWQDYIR